MSDDFMQQLAGAKVFGSGNRFTAGSGILIVKDLKVFKGAKKGSDPFTEAAEFVVKSSKPLVDGILPNSPGSMVSTVFFLSVGEYVESQLSNALKCHLAILGPGADALLAPTKQAELAEKLTWLLRPLPAGNPLAGRTDPAKPCPARGYQVAYQTRKGSNGGYYPDFFPVDTTPEELAENLEILAGKKKIG